MRKILSAWGIILLMLVLVVGTAAAESGVDGTATPTAVPTSQPAESTGYVHPVVQILSAYFGRTDRPMMPTATPTDTPTVDPNAPATDTPTVDPNAPATATPTPEPVLGPADFAKQIEMYHEEGMGFGVLVKLYAMAEASKEKCAAEPSTGDIGGTTTAAADTEPCTPVDVDTLVTDFQSGKGMGALFSEYGKPALLGVGHVKKALKHNQDEETTTTTTTTVTDDTQTSKDSKDNKGNKPAKDTKPAKPGKGPKK